LLLIELHLWGRCSSANEHRAFSREKRAWFISGLIQVTT
jgi:hypothetical protein